MSWTHAERYYRTLHAVEDALDRRGTAALPDSLPWHDELADVFGTPQRLRLALLARWYRLLQAQGDDVPVADLVAAHPGLARVAGMRSGSHAAEMVAS